MTSNLPLGKVDVDGNAYVRKLIKTGRMFIDFMPNHGGIIRFNVDQCRPLEIVIPDFVVGGTEYELHIIYENNTSMPFLPSPLVPYAVLKDGTLTFYYDTNKPNEAYGLRTEDKPEWELVKDKITEVVFDQSFKNFKPTTCAYLCSHFNYITEIVGMKENLNSDDVTDMTSMFSGCCLLKTIDLSGFNTSKVTSMDFLFYNCRNLRAIFVDDNWNTSSVYQNTDLFASCNKLFGGKGTSVYDVGVYNDISYAQVDKGSSNPGFLTKYGDPVFSTQVPYVLVEGNTATFYYGYEPDGALYAMAEGWPNATDITKVVFDESFKNFKPKSYANLFNGLKKLTEIKGMDQNLNSELVTDMRYMFMHCESLQSIDLSWAKTANVYYMTNILNIDF